MTARDNSDVPQHFAFPFDLTPEPEDLFAAAALTEAQARLKHLLELCGIGLVTGKAGCGKTTVCRKVNRIAHYALTGAAIDKAQTVTAEHVQSACEELAP